MAQHQVFTVGVVMGSESDWRVMLHAVNVLEALGVSHEVKIVSAHRTPKRLWDYGTTARKRGIRVIIAGAGGSAHLPGMLAALAVGVPVLGVPVNDKNGIGAKDAAARGSMDEMPPGVPLASFSLGEAGAKNAAQFAAAILGVSNEEVYESIVKLRKEQTKKVPTETHKRLTSSGRGGYMQKYPLTVEDVPLLHQGKTRDTFATNDPNKLLVVASDRLSTHNVVHKSTVPCKGRVLTALTIHWAREIFDRMGVEHHLIASGDRIGKHLLPGKYPDDITQRAIVVERLMMLLVEFIYRGYLAGSLYDKFYKLGIDNPYSVKLMSGLPLMHRFWYPIFTPTDKSEDDDPLSAHNVGRDHPIAAPLGMNVYVLLREHLNARGLELVDTKFEMGINTRGRVVMADEYGTPDSSRFAQLADITEGKPPPWFDKQFFRDIAEHMWGTGPKTPLEFSDHALESGTRVYLDLFEMAVGTPLASFDLNYHQ